MIFAIVQKDDFIGRIKAYHIFKPDSLVFSSLFNNYPVTLKRFVIRKVNIFHDLRFRSESDKIRFQVLYLRVQDFTAS